MSWRSSWGREREISLSNLPSEKEENGVGRNNKCFGVVVSFLSLAISNITIALSVSWVWDWKCTASGLKSPHLPGWLVNSGNCIYKWFLAQRMWQVLWVHIHSWIAKLCHGRFDRGNHSYNYYYPTFAIYIARIMLKLGTWNTAWSSQMPAKLGKRLSFSWFAQDLREKRLLGHSFSEVHFQPLVWYLTHLRRRMFHVALIAYNCNAKFSLCPSGTWRWVLHVTIVLRKLLTPFRNPFTTALAGMVLLDFSASYLASSLRVTQCNWVVVDPGGTKERTPSHRTICLWYSLLQDMIWTYEPAVR